MFLVFITIILTAISFIFNPKKTLLGLKIGSLMFIKLLPSLLSILMIISLILALVSNDLLIKLIGQESGFFGVFLAGLIGSIVLMPGFIAYPISNIMLKSGVSYAAVSMFITTLMMVGILTIPLEKNFFGLKVAILRNALSFVAAVFIGLFLGFLMGLK